MLYEMNNKIYIYANNKYYEIELKNGSIFPTSKYVLSLENAAQVTLEQAMNKLSKLEDREDNEIKLTRRYKDR